MTASGKPKNYNNMAVLDKKNLGEASLSKSSGENLVSNEIKKIINDVIEDNKEKYKKMFSGYCDKGFVLFISLTKIEGQMMFLDSQLLNLFYNNDLSDELKEKNHTAIQSHIFSKDDYMWLSAVILSFSDIFSLLDCAKDLKNISYREQAGQSDFILFHNPKATVTFPRNILSMGRGEDWDTLCSPVSK